MHHMKPHLSMSLRVFCHIRTPTSKAEKCLLSCFHLDNRDALAFPVYLYHDPLCNCEIQCHWFTGRNLGIRTSVRRCVSGCVHEVCMRRRWPSCLNLSKATLHLLLLQHNIAPDTFIVFSAPPQSIESLPLCLMVLDYHWEKQINIKTP